MIRTFSHKGLSELWNTGTTERIASTLHKRIAIRLASLDAATVPGDLNLPGYAMHSLKGFDPKRYTIHINGPWCLTFSFEGQDLVAIDLERYH